MTWALPSPVMMPGGGADQPEPELWVYHAAHNRDHDGVTVARGVDVIQPPLSIFHQ
jgi:hypothetical protein